MSFKMKLQSLRVQPFPSQYGYLQLQLVWAVLFSLVIASQCSVVINEIRLSTDVNNSKPFVELYNNGNEDFSITNFVLVFFNSSSAYAVIQLPTAVLPGRGYYVIGSVGLDPAPDLEWTCEDCMRSSLVQGAVGLYDGEVGVVDIHVGMQPTSGYLEDALIFKTLMSVDASELARNFGKEAVAILDPLYLPKPSLSVSRCVRENETMYVVTTLSPKLMNNCDRRVPLSPVVINEVNALNPGEDTQEYVELYNKANTSISLDDYTIVLYGGGFIKAYGLITLENATIGPLGYFLVGSANLVPTPDKVVGDDRTVNILRNSIAAMGLYRGDTSHLSPTNNATNASLVDAVVYDREGRDAQELADVLTPGQMAIHENSSVIAHLDESIGRCAGNDRVNASQFTVMHLTPGAENDCSPLQVPPTLPVLTTRNPDASLYLVISEFRISGLTSFIELYDGGIGYVALDNVVLHFTSASASSVPISEELLSLSGFSTNLNGRFLIRRDDGQTSGDYDFPFVPAISEFNAIALYYESNSSHLLDAVLYGEPTSLIVQDLMSTLAPGQEPLPHNAADQSWSRCKGWDPFRQDSFMATNATPRFFNNCPLPPIVINEINVLAEDGANQFIELFDGGVGSQSLDGLVVAVYDGHNNRAFLVMDLTGYSTDVAGFLVLAPRNGTDVDYVVDTVDGVFLQEGPDAVAIHVGPANFFRDRLASERNLVDAVVFGTDDVPDLDLLHRLLPNQHHLNELPSSSTGGDQSISRCSCCLQGDPSSFGSAPASPGALNVDCFRDNSTFTETVEMYHRQMRISEVKFDDGPGGGGFMEIYDGGLGGVELNGLHLDINTLNDNDESRFLRFNLSNSQTNRDGYFVVHSPSADILPTVIVNRTGLVMEEASFNHHTPLILQSAGGYVQLVSLTLDTVLDSMTFGSDGTVDWMLLGSTDSSQPLIRINGSVRNGSSSIQRCYSPASNEQLAYAVSTPTPGVDNSCPAPPIVVNEINTESSVNDLGEFIELFSLGIPNFPINNITVASMNGATGQVHRSLTLNGRHTDSHGLLMIGYKRSSFPPPDVPRFKQPDGWVRDGPDSVAIFRGKSQFYPEGTVPTATAFIDKVDYGISNYSGGVEMTISRCKGANGSVTYELTNASPKAVNRCPARRDALLVINEVKVGRGTQFLEIWDLGNGFTSLDDFVVVIYGPNDRASAVFTLSGHQTSQAGYFIMTDDQQVESSLHSINIPEGLSNSSYSAVALYRQSAAFTHQRGSPPVQQGLMDAVVYSDWTNGSTTALSLVLAPGALPIPYDLLHSTYDSICRCFSVAPLSLQSFLVCPASSNALNLCPSFITDVVINEVNVDLPGADILEFIELYDGGRGNVSLDFTTLVLFDGAAEDRSYVALGLDGLRTNADGYFVIGSHLHDDTADLQIQTSRKGFLQNGPDGIALYRAHVGAFPYGTRVTSSSLIDAVVYSTNNRGDRDLVDALVPGHFVLKEDRTHLADDESLSRCHGLQRRDSTVYALTLPTPGRANNCTTYIDFDSSVIISEVRIDGYWTFVEVYDRGVGNTSLDDLVLVFYNGHDDALGDRAYFRVDLSNKITGGDGYFLIDGSVIPDDLIHGTSVAVVLYRGSPDDYPLGSAPSQDGIQDAVVYGQSLVADLSLMTMLANGQLQVAFQQGASASRCLSDRPVSMAAFISATPTPGSGNNCTSSPIIINELNLGNQDQHIKEFVELYDGGQGSTPLDSLILVLFSGVNGGRAYKTVPLQGHRTDQNGYFLIGTSEEGDMDVVITSRGHSFLRGGASAVALYQGDHRDYQPGMPATPIGLVDALVYGSEGRGNSTPLNQLLEGQEPIPIDQSFKLGSSSYSRCICCLPLQSATFHPAIPSPRQPNTCTPHPVTPPTNLQVVINEIRPSGVMSSSGGEFVELKGQGGAALDDYVLVIFSVEGGEAMATHVVDLMGQQLDGNGLILIGGGGGGGGGGASSSSSLSRIPLSGEGRTWLKPDQGAVGIFEGRSQDYIAGTWARVNRIVDAVVYQDSTTAADDQLRVLTMNGNVFVMETSYLSGEATISRCTCCELRTNHAFMLSAPTPGGKNMCPERRFGKTVQLRLTDADYSQWKTQPEMMVALRGIVVSGVKDQCKCEFNSIYLKDEQLLNGSVIYEFLLTGLSASQASDLFDAYSRFVRQTRSVWILGEVFTVDNDCVVDCSTKAHNSLAILQHPAPSVIVGVTVTAIIVVIFAAAVASYLRKWRKRGDDPIMLRVMRWFKGSAECDGEFRVTDACQLDDLDVLSREAKADNFVNPVYNPASPPTLLVIAPSNGEGEAGNEPVSVELEVDTSISYA